MNRVDEAVLICPGCGAFGSIEAFANHQDAAACQAILGRLPPDVAAALQRYVRLFAPAKHVMTWRRQRRVLEQLAAAIEAEKVVTRGREWPAPHPTWIRAMNSMLDSKTLQLPLKSNGYLISIIAGEANSAEAKAERDIEAKRQTGQVETGVAVPVPASSEAAVRQAVAMLVSHATALRMKFGQDCTDSDARQFLVSRYPASVIDAAISTWKRGVK